MKESHAIYVEEKYVNHVAHAMKTIGRMNNMTITMIGIFLKGHLLLSYPDNEECYVSALQEALDCTKETGVLHEVKRYEQKVKGV